MKRSIAIVFIMFPFMLTAGGKETGNPIETHLINGITIRLIKEGKHYHAIAEAILPVKPEYMWEALTDFSRHPEFIPTLKKLKVTPLDDNNRFLLESTSKVSLLTVKLIMINTLEVKECCRIRRWEQRKGILSVNYGSWTVFDAGNGATKAVYEQVLYHPLLSRHTIKNLLTKSLPDMYAQFSGRAMKLQKEKRLQQY